MADGTYQNTLAGALSGLRISGAENPYGMGLLALNQAAPALYNPYGSTGSNVGIAIGQTLLSALLGYQAKKQATEESIQATNLASQLMQTPAAQRASFLESLKQQDVPVNVMGRITDLAPVLMQNELIAQAQDAQAKRELRNQVLIEYAKQGYPIKGFEDIGIAPQLDTTTGAPALSPKQKQEIELAKAKTLAEEQVKQPAKQAEQKFQYDKEVQSTRRALENDPITKAYAESKTALRSARELAQKDSVTATVALKKIAERAFNPGNQVTMQELSAYKSVMPILDQYRTWIESKTSGSSDLTPEAKAQLVDAVETVVNNLGKSYNEKVQSNFDFVKKKGWTQDINDVAPFQIHIPREQALSNIAQIQQKLLQHKAAVQTGKPGLSPELLKQLEDQYSLYKESL